MYFKFIESQIIQGKKILIKMRDISTVYEAGNEYPDFKTKYKVALSNGNTFTFDEEHGEKIYNTYKAYLQGEK